jgi:phosphate-selective porin OprO/OprP
VPISSVGFVVNQPGVGVDPPPNGPSSATVDREAIQAIVREELAAAAEKTPAPADAVSKPEPQSTVLGKDRTLQARWDNGFVAESVDKAFRIHLGGRFEFDNSWFNQDDNILIGPSPDSTMHDGTLMRRARFRADGRLWEFTDFAAEVNFANIQDVSNVDNALVQVGSVGLTDFYVTFREVPWLGNVRMGHLQAPISLERYSSSNAWYYMERSSMFDAFYNPNDYQNGVVVFDSYLDDQVTLAGSAAWIGKSDVQSFGFGANEGKFGYGARVTALPYYENEGRSLLHVGAGYFHQTLVDHRFSIASRELLRAGAGSSDTPNLIFTGTFFSPNGADVVNAEAAYVVGPWSLSSEYAVTHVNDVFEQAVPTFAGARGDATYQATYVEGGVFVTPGDQRRYDKKTGTWARTLPVENAYFFRQKNCGPIHSEGAVQLVARYTFLDLISGDPILTPTSGGARAGEQHDVTLGVNWYINSQMWFMLNYVATRIDSVVPGASGDIHGVGCRLHLDF